MLDGLRDCLAIVAAQACARLVQRDRLALYRLIEQHRPQTDGINVNSVGHRLGHTQRIGHIPAPGGWLRGAARIRALQGVKLAGVAQRLPHVLDIAGGEIALNGA